MSFVSFCESVSRWGGTPRQAWAKNGWSPTRAKKGLRSCTGFYRDFSVEFRRLQNLILSFLYRRIFAEARWGWDCLAFFWRFQKGAWSNILSTALRHNLPPQVNPSSSPWAQQLSRRYVVHKLRDCRQGRQTASMAMICSGKFLLFLFFSRKRNRRSFQGLSNAVLFSMAKDVRTKQKGEFPWWVWWSFMVTPRCLWQNFKSHARWWDKLHPWIRFPASLLESGIPSFGISLCSVQRWNRRMGITTVRSFEYLAVKLEVFLFKKEKGNLRIVTKWEMEQPFRSSWNHQANYLLC